MNSEERGKLSKLIEKNRKKKQLVTSSKLSENWHAMLQALGKAFKAGNSAAFYSSASSNGEAVSAPDQNAVNGPAVAHILQFIWSLPGIENVDPADLTCLIAHRIPDLFVIHMAENWDSETDELIFSDGSIDADIVSQSTDHVVDYTQEGYDKLRTFFKTLYREQSAQENQQASDEARVMDGAASGQGPSTVWLFPHSSNFNGAVNSSNHNQQGDALQSAQANVAERATQANVAHATQANVSHVTQANVAHATQANVAHATLANLAHATQPNVAHATQANVAQETQANVAQETQGSSSQDMFTGHDSVPANPAEGGPPENPDRQDTPKENIEESWRKFQTIRRRLPASDLAWAELYEKELDTFDRERAKTVSRDLVATRMLYVLVRKLSEFVTPDGILLACLAGLRFFSIGEYLGLAIKPRDS
ncbi:hypothetical protein ElyMa_006928400 [Elysia marginata]|uniref:Uncharacterized protein n=1 Tax=Elysia marginata TaxID=1093978 RepID=A0AAV4JFK0_9GAST|nr:hypothetical protein ElyMa_006928400 [Elysia marginata]